MKRSLTCLFGSRKLSYHERSSTWFFWWPIMQGDQRYRGDWWMFRSTDRSHKSTGLHITKHQPFLQRISNLNWFLYHECRINLNTWIGNPFHWCSCYHHWGKVESWNHWVRKWRAVARHSSRVDSDLCAREIRKGKKSNEVTKFKVEQRQVFNEWWFIVIREWWLYIAFRKKLLHKQ